ncbi:MAG: dephospho-CoA kinase [Gammaproteobacteria bacterium]|nr:dephospho-CoA kinase [Gammaproteobacteria bacterium]
MVLKIGLTGGIGSGKSTACEIFSEFGVPVIDADIIAHSLVKPGMPALQAIIDEFGEGIVTKDGSLDRKKLRDQIFTNETDRKKLENILHPAIYNEIAHETEDLLSKYCIIALPLLLETGASKIIDRILVIDSPRELQLSRASIRDNVSKSDIETIMHSQISPDDRLAVADDIVNNDGDIDNLRRQICDLHRFYTSI